MLLLELVYRAVTSRRHVTARADVVAARADVVAAKAAVGAWRTTLVDASTAPTGAATLLAALLHRGRLASSVSLWWL